MFMPIPLTAAFKAVLEEREVLVVGDDEASLKAFFTELRKAARAAGRLEGGQDYEFGYRRAFLKTDDDARYTGVLAADARGGTAALVVLVNPLVLPDERWARVIAPLASTNQTFFATSIAVPGARP